MTEFPHPEVRATGAPRRMLLGARALSFEARACARAPQDEVREAVSLVSRLLPDCAALYPGYDTAFLRVNLGTFFCWARKSTYVAKIASTSRVADEVERASALICSLQPTLCTGCG
jgi:hypothetical protein